MSNQQSGRKTRRDVLFSFCRRMEQVTGMTNVEGDEVRKEVKTVALGPVAWRSLVALAAAFQPGYGMGAGRRGQSALWEVGNPSKSGCDLLSAATVRMASCTAPRVEPRGACCPTRSSAAPCPTAVSTTPNGLSSPSAQMVWVRELAAFRHTFVCVTSRPGGAFACTRPSC